MTNGNKGGTSRAALLELRREREMIEQGHRFLDEKRMQLARELLRRIDVYEKIHARLAKAWARAGETLKEAVTDYGLADIQVYPAYSELEVEWHRKEQWYLGLLLPDMELSWRPNGLEAQPAIERPSVEEVGKRCAAVVEIAAAEAAMLTAMFRLDEEYKRTERSVRALENVVMPEIREQEKAGEEALAEIEQEEAVRVRLFGPQQPAK